MSNNYETLKEKALNAYVGWAVGYDIVTPMRNLKSELEDQGVDVDSIVSESRILAKKKYEEFNKITQ